MSSQEVALNSLYEPGHSGTPRRPAPCAPRARRGENILSALEYSRRPARRGENILEDLDYRPAARTFWKF